MARLRLADVERERADEPFEIEGADGRVYVLPHPKSLQYEQLAALEGAYTNPDALRILFGEDYEAFAGEKQLDGFALEAIMDGWRKQFGLPSPGERGASRR